ncbi:hypothetical protein K443DRAFT_106785 [Laccaria amethystina LaAM-08-1]|uniref:Wax synthase domain-containing protein n=1 Tax=Laccaria amethystina LaAM-08-1 TaxID=1095629 RepID=A0A0C9XGD4_9AGAR|nr:hypothetical protein K443DRAFT_106785 [Laccaria amethystina LaAM-08-1]
MVNATVIEALFSHLTFFFALVARPSPSRKLFFLPIFCANIWLLLCVPLPEGSTKTARFRGYGLAFRIATASDFILLTDVQNDLRLQNDNRRIPSASLGARMLWVVRLLTAHRGVGWTYEPTARLPRRSENLSRWAFVVYKISWAVYYYILSDLLQVLLQWNLAVVKGESYGTETVGWLLARTTFIAYLVEINVSLNLPYNVVAAVSVFLGLTEAREWPALFGYWSDGYTVGRFWGRVWHQNLRRIVTVHSKFILKNIFSLTSGTSLAWHVQLYAAFAISGLVHLAGDYIALGDWTTGGSMRFFVLQAMAITFEDIVINLASRIGFGRTTRLSKFVGYMWVLGWFIWSVPGWTRPWAIVSLGQVDVHQSVILRICQKVLRLENWLF